MTDHAWCEAFVGGEIEGVGQTVQQTVSVLEAKLREVREEERERCARLYESIDPASDYERLKGFPGAGAMGAVIEYRDKIRSLHPTPPSGREG